MDSGRSIGVLCIAIGTVLAHGPCSAAAGTPAPSSAAAGAADAAQGQSPKGTGFELDAGYRLIFHKTQADTGYYQLTYQGTELFGSGKALTDANAGTAPPPTAASIANSAISSPLSLVLSKGVAKTNTPIFDTAGQKPLSIQLPFLKQVSGTAAIYGSFQGPKVTAAVGLQNTWHPLSPFNKYLSVANWLNAGIDGEWSNVASTAESDHLNLTASAFLGRGFGWVYSEHATKSAQTSIAKQTGQPVAETTLFDTAADTLRIAENDPRTNDDAGHEAAVALQIIDGLCILKPPGDSFNVVSAGVAGAIKAPVPKSVSLTWTFNDNKDGTGTYKVLSNKDVSFAGLAPHTYNESGKWSLADPMHNVLRLTPKTIDDKHKPTVHVCTFDVVSPTAFALNTDLFGTRTVRYVLQTPTKTYFPLKKYLLYDPADWKGYVNTIGGALDKTPNYDGDAIFTETYKTASQFFDPKADLQKINRDALAKAVHDSLAHWLDGTAWTKYVTAYFSHVLPDRPTCAISVEDSIQWAAAGGTWAAGTRLQNIAAGTLTWWPVPREPTKYWVRLRYENGRERSEPTSYLNQVTFTGGVQF
jgi:hypothetical protein